MGVATKALAGHDGGGEHSPGAQGGRGGGQGATESALIQAAWPASRSGHFMRR